MATRQRSTIGPLLRTWRQRRRLSQLQLAVEADVSTRHLSWIETGRSTPSREMVLHLAEALQVPLRERNQLLLAAGHVPEYTQLPLDAPEMAPVADAVTTILTGSEPNPAVVVDRYYDLLAANPTALWLTTGSAPHLLEPPINVVRLSLHPEGMAPRIANLQAYGAHLVDRLRRTAEVTGDPRVVDLLEEVTAYLPSGPAHDPEAAHGVVLPMALRVDGEQLSFVSTIAAFGTAIDVTAAELAIESFFPADRHTAEVLARRAAARAPQDA